MNCYANCQKLILIALVCLMSFMSYATTYYVATSGIDDTDSRSPVLTSGPWFRGSFDNTLRKPSPYFELNPVSPNISPAINAGTAIAGFTGNAIGVPDLGALELGVNNANSWVTNPNAVGARGDAGASARQAAEQVSGLANEGPSTPVYPNPSTDGEIYVEVANAAEVGLEFRTVLGTAVPFT